MEYLTKICENVNHPITVWKVIKNDARVIYCNKFSKYQIGNNYSNIYPENNIPNKNTELIKNNVLVKFIILDKTHFSEIWSTMDNTIFVLEAINQKIRAPLTNISGVVDMIDVNSIEKNELKEYLKILKISGSDILQVALNLTYLINLKKNNIKINYEKINPKNLITKCIKLSSMNISRDNKNISIKNKINGNIPMFIKGDSELIEYIIISILDFLIENIQQGNIMIDSMIEDKMITIKFSVAEKFSDELSSNIKSILNNININIKSYECFGLCLYISNLILNLLDGELNFVREKIETFFVMKLKL